MPRLLVIDDEPNVLYSLEKSLRSDALEVLTASTAKEGIELAQRRRPDAVLLDVRLPDMSGLDAFDRLRQIDPRLPIIVITAYATTDTAIEAMKRGAFEYLLKPGDFHRLREVVDKALELSRLRHVPAVFEQQEAMEDETVDRIVGSSPAMQEVYKAIGRVAPLDVTVLIVGESGTGKELVARALYQHSRRTDKPFLAMNCAAVPESLLESELFGHERGAFTGAERRRIGKFEQAHQGTLFLDEIGDMALSTQAKMLRVLQEQRFERLGGNETIQTDVRVIAATNQDLDEAVSAGRFRQDLLYRLNGFTIHLPPLRERREDLPLLVEHFVKVFNRDLGRQVRLVSPDAMRILEAYPWPGNVRELQSSIRYALVHAPSELLTSECLPESLRDWTPAGAGGTGIAPVSPASGFDLSAHIQRLLHSGEEDIYRKACEAADRVILEAILRHTRGNQVQASELLGISRTTLRAKMKALGMIVEKQILPESDAG
ncbi:MAG TPA: sigma-54 dependent transcriptional regulator [Gemmataceae bacterium]|nr:sigma-54 dependent transcriptional regulator [Gemmataceae bacterium]